MREEGFFLIKQIFTECFLDTPCTVPGPGDPRPCLKVKEFQARQAGI